MRSAFVCESGNATAAGGRLSVDVRTGEVFYDLFLFDSPGVLEDNVFALRWRSMISGSSQLGNSVLPGWETTVEKVILDAGKADQLGAEKLARLARVDPTLLACTGPVWGATKLFPI